MSMKLSFAPKLNNTREPKMAGVGKSVPRSPEHFKKGYHFRMKTTFGDGGMPMPPPGGAPMGPPGAPPPGGAPAGGPPPGTNPVDLMKKQFAAVPKKHRAAVKKMVIDKLKAAAAQGPGAGGPPPGAGAPPPPPGMGAPPPAPGGMPPPPPPGMKRGGKVKMASGGSVRGVGIAVKGGGRGRFV